MKVKRLKRANKILTFYKYNYKLIPPYKIIVDGTFCKSALEEQLNLAEQVPKYLSEETHLMTTKCVLKELESFGPLLYGALVIAKKLQIANCPHENGKPASECLAHLARRAASGKEKYFFATQDEELTETLRNIVGTPILYIKYKTILIDNISEASKNGTAMKDPELLQLKELKSKIIPAPEIRKKKKKKGVNPLSCKKKVMKPKTTPVATGPRTSSGKRKRIKKKKNITVEE